MIHSRVSWMLAPVLRSITVSAPHMVALHADHQHVSAELTTTLPFHVTSRPDMAVLAYIHVSVTHHCSFSTSSSMLLLTALLPKLALTLVRNLRPTRSWHRCVKLAPG